ncbi:esterase/lipase family protein [Nocardia sp. NPDC052566]|uniref:esterase/lipase family protein n=1 Tax=Nocardia sp. NPDC052566 TaxID=3364330 RepID=UPI0037C4F9FE
MALTSVVLAAALLTTAAVGSATPSGLVDAPVAPTQLIAAAKKQDANLPVFGANDWTCKPSAAHPHPVVLVHGTFAPPAAVFADLAPLLKLDGYCLFALHYGLAPILGEVLPGVQKIDQVAEELSTYVDGVLAATGAKQVDIVGHSLGGMMPRQYLRFNGGAAKVRTLVGISPTNYGTELFGINRLAQLLSPVRDGVTALCPACTDQLDTSEFIEHLNAGGDTEPGVAYTVIASLLDQVAQPAVKSSFLRDANPKVDNILLQDVCPIAIDMHQTTSLNPLVIRLVRNALDPDHATGVDCTNLINP